ncbi:D-alanyl-D-alanine carboxypeptidase [Alicyclobacillus sp. SO9]|nr:D-alanyl-D-alanine carboxypeptidase [Alicyclobacillus sp. SO9]
MDFATKKVLFEKDANKELPMASITKIMTMLLAMEAIEKGQLKLTDTITASEHAASMGGSQIFLEPGEKMSLNDMMKGIAMASANDACVAIAEHMAGTESEFVKKMNQRAKELGMNHTHFVNCNGLPAEHHYSSAKDVAVMSRALLQHQQITKWTSVYSDYLRENSSHPLWLVNTNKLVRFYDGMDGLKTGYTSEAKYCLSATAKRKGFRVIAVAMGEPKITIRNREITQMLDWTFGQYTSKILYQPQQVIRQVRVPHGVPERVSIQTSDTVGVIHKKGEKPNYKTQVELNKLKAPIKAGQKVGTLKIVNDDDVVASATLVSAQSVRKANLFESIGQTTKHLFTFGKH